MLAAPLVLTMGEPAGIGGELTLMAWLRRDEYALAPFFIIDNPSRLNALAQALNLPVPIAEISHPTEAAALFGKALPVLPIQIPSPVIAGRPDTANGRAVISAITMATELVVAGKAAAMVTNPIHKSSLYACGFKYPGHTEFLTALANCKNPPVMLLEGGGLRVVPVTIHIALRDVTTALSINGIVTAGRICAAALSKDFGIASPRLAVAALNPHAGESGTLGNEERVTIGPAVEALRAHGVDATGPYPADTLFHKDARARYDAVLCMYHDQALIPLKTLDFETGINITLGLPFVRTSPDHGTALAIAGTGQANPASLIAAIRRAAQLAAVRANAVMAL